MTGLRNMTVEDILSIKDDLVEDRPIWKALTEKAAQWLVDAGYIFTYWKDDKVVAVCGAIRQGNNWTLWAMYSKKFSAFAFARIDAVMAFSKRFKALWAADRETTGSTATFGIPSDLKNGAKYAKLIGGIFVRQEPSQIFPGITNDIYEVV